MPHIDQTAVKVSLKVCSVSSKPEILMRPDLSCIGCLMEKLRQSQDPLEYKELQGLE